MEWDRREKPCKKMRERRALRGIGRKQVVLVLVVRRKASARAGEMKEAWAQA